MDNSLRKARHVIAQTTLKLYPVFKVLNAGLKELKLPNAVMLPQVWLSL
jgi:hypothetical protein